MRVLALILSLFITGCAIAVSYSPMNPLPHSSAPRQAALVELHSVAPNDRPFVDVGVLEAINLPGASKEEVEQRLRIEAGKIGCDALVLRGYRGNTATYDATCIVYK
jgi:hypothetical protein